MCKTNPNIAETSKHQITLLQYTHETKHSIVCEFIEASALVSKCLTNIIGKGYGL